MGKSLIIGGLHVQDHEFFYPFYRLRESFDVVHVATKGGAETTSNKGSIIRPDLSIAEVPVSDYDLLVLPGGAHAMEYMRQDRDLINLVSNFDSAGKVIACICQGAQLLISARIVKGRTLSGYYSLKDDIENAGATYLDEPAVIDVNLVTTAHYKDMAPWLKTAIDLALLRQQLS